jgi:ubiquinone/menaquinone biosynthesis C-methylase UbiE
MSTDGEHAFLLRIARERFTIHAGERVLDVGCGASPFPPSTHLCDVLWSDDRTRLVHGPPRSDLPFFLASVESLPFADKAFDFVHCTHVLEHVPDPIAACRELSRVGRRGYVECPAAWIERLFHAPEHRWLVDHERGRLVFRELLDEERQDLLGLQFEILELLKDDRFRAHWNRAAVRRERLVEFYWEGRIECEVIPRAERRNRGALRWFYRANPTDGPGPALPGKPDSSLHLRGWRDE